MISSLAWVPRGVARENPHRQAMSDEEAQAMKAMMAEEQYERTITR